MILDQLCMFTDGVPVLSTSKSASVCVMPFLGKADPLSIFVSVTEAYSASATLTVGIEESYDNTTFTSLATHMVPPAKLTRPGPLFFGMPQSLRGKYVRLSYTVGGSPVKGKLMAGIVCGAVEGMEPGQYVTAGRKVQ